MCNRQPPCMYCSASKYDIFSKPYIIIIDSEIVLNQINVLEEKSLMNIVVPESVLNQVRQQNLDIYKKLEKILSSCDRQFFIFPDTKLKNTSIVSKAGETIKEMQQKNVRSVAKWYNVHLNAQNLDIKAILLTDDEVNKKKAAEEGIPTTQDYILSLSKTQASSLTSTNVHKSCILMNKNKNEHLIEQIYKIIL